MNRTLYFFFVFCFVFCHAQQDSIFVHAKLKEGLRTVEISQEISYHNPFQDSISKIKLLNWISAYRTRRTPLLKRKLQDHKKDLYFADAADLGKVEDLRILIDGKPIQNLDPDDENLYLQLEKPLKKSEKARIQLKYQLKLPNINFTGHGFSKDKISLKYVFIVPDSFDSSNQYGRYYRDLEEAETTRIFWKINLEYPKDLFVISNLPASSSQIYEGFLNDDPEFLFTAKALPNLDFKIDQQNIKIQFGYLLTELEKSNLEFLLPLQLHYLKDKLGFLPSTFFITERLKKDDEFIGNDDLHFWKFHYKLFSDAAEMDMDYFPLLSKNILTQTLSFNKENDHWLINGLKTYLEIEYLKKFYKNEKLLGALPDEVKIFGLKPLKIFNASKLKLTERYGLAYRYIESENSDQKIQTPYSKLSNLNKTIISNFEIGSLFDFIADKMTTMEFDIFLKKFISENANKPLDSKVFLDQLAINSNYSSEFLENFIARKQKVNFNLRSYKRIGENLQIKISKNTPEKIPFKIDTEDHNGAKKEFWFDTSVTQKPVLYIIPDGDAEKIQVNDHYSFPENDYRDNYLYTKGLFSNAKRLRFKLITDIPNPEYNEVFVSPRLNFNVYDKLLLGFNFKNNALFKRKFTYSLSPYYSTGTNQMTGSAGLGYNFMPAESFFRMLTLGVSASYFHYDFNLSYSTISTAATLRFSKDPRTDVSQTASFAYNHFQRDLSPQMILNKDYGKYNIYSFNYTYDSPALIFEKYFSSNLQIMEDYQKISFNGSYRYEFAKNKKASVRLFAGAFLKNNTRNNFFDFGIDKISNYSFSYGLLGQSATSGVFSQQLIIADGGFKSYFGNTVNDWITSLNADINIWKWFYLYADAGLYKNKLQPTKFIWDSGIKFAILPDFLELYFPMQSSLGFEPGFKDYSKRIRYTLVFNLSAITNRLRRGVY